VGTAGLAARVAGWRQSHSGLPADSRGTLATPPTVTFPTTPLAGRVYLALGADLTQSWTTWSWTDVTSRVLYAAGIGTRQGRPDESGTVLASSAQLVLDNTDGALSRRNPTSPFYGQLTFNTPIWGTVDAGTGPQTRLAMFVNEWPTRWDRSGNQSVVTIQCAGILRRLQQGTVSKSAMRRTILASNPVAYWPLEDGTTATAGASVTGGFPMTAPGVQFANVSDMAGSAATPDLSAGHLIGTVTGVSASSWHAEFAIKMPYNSTAIARVYTASADGCVYRFFLPGAVGGTPTVFIDGSGGVTGIVGPAAVDGFDAAWHHIGITATQDGANVVSQFYVDGVLQGTDTSVRTLGSPTLFLGNQNAINVTSISHVAFGNGTTLSNAAAAIDGFGGELAHNRIIRVCREVGITLACTAGRSPVMGPQAAGTDLSVLREAERVDQGVLYETMWGLGYQSLHERTNAPVALTLDFAQGHIAIEPSPADDDQRLRNRWTADRLTGSYAVSEQTTGPYRVGPGGPGVYDDGVTVNVVADDDLPDQAGWRRHLGTIDEDRWPSIALRFHGSPELIDAWLALPYGARLNMLNPPSQMAPDTIDAITEGWSERWDGPTWIAELTTAPYTPYRIGTYVDDAATTTTDSALVYAADSLSLAVGVDTTETSWLVTSSPLWTTSAASFPRLIFWEGEVVRLTNCTGGSAPQTWTVVRSVNGVAKPHLANSTGSLYRPGVLALA
jgi:hypothetical protein